MQNKKNEHPDSVVEFVRKLADEVGGEAVAATCKVDGIPRPENAERGTGHFVFRGPGQSVLGLLLTGTYAIGANPGRADVSAELVAQSKH